MEEVGKRYQQLRWDDPQVNITEYLPIDNAFGNTLASDQLVQKADTLAYIIGLVQFAAVYCAAVAVG